MTAVVWWTFKRDPDSSPSTSATRFGETTPSTQSVGWDFTRDPPQESPRPRPTQTDRYGQVIPLDLVGISDIDPFFATTVDPHLIVSQRIVRRLTTPRGMLPWAPEDGFDVRTILNATMTTDRLTTYSRVIKQEIEKDEAVETANVLVQYNYPSKKLQIPIVLETVYGGWSMTMLVDSVTVDVLRQS